MPAWTTGTALVTPSAIQLMPPVMAGLTLSSHARAELDERGFEVAGGSLDGAGAGGRFHGGVGEAERHDRVVEFLRGDLPSAMASRKLPV